MIKSYQFNTRAREISVSMDLDLTCSDDADLNTYFLHAGPPEPELCHVLFRVLRSGDFAVDAGANIGFFTIMMAQLVGPAGGVAAIEPQTINNYKLGNNLRLNALKNVQIYNCALWDELTTLQLHGINGTAYTTSDFSNTTVEAKTYDSLITSPVRMVKMDIEGSEVRAVLGGRRLRDVPYVVCEINAVALERQHYKIEDLVKAFADLGKQPFVIDINGVLPALIHPGMKLVPAKQNTNILFSTIANVVAAWPEVTP